MSKATKRKHVTQEVLGDFVLPSDGCTVVKVCAGRGNNLHEVQNELGETFLASMPTKFRKNVWIKRGDYVMVTPIAEGDKVKAEITHILYKEQIKHIKNEGLWPRAFDNEVAAPGANMIPDDMLPPSGSDDDSDGERNDLDMIQTCNPNRPPVQYRDSDDSSAEESDESSHEQNGGEQAVGSLLHDDEPTR